MRLGLLLIWICVLGCATIKTNSVMPDALDQYNEYCSIKKEVLNKGCNDVIIKYSRINFGKKDKIAVCRIYEQWSWQHFNYITHNHILIDFELYNHHSISKIELIFHEMLHCDMDIGHTDSGLMGPVHQGYSDNYARELLVEFFENILK